MQSASWWAAVREAGEAVGDRWVGSARAPGKGPGVAGGDGEEEPWERAARDIELVRQQLAAARRGPLAELRAAAAAADAERTASAASGLGWTLGSVRMRLRDAEDAGAGAADLVGEIHRLREDERALAREVGELEGRVEEVRARMELPRDRSGLTDSLVGLYRWATPELVDAPGRPEATEPQAGATAREWVQHHSATLEEAVANRLSALPLEPGHPRLRWSADGGRFLARVLIGVSALADADTCAGVRRAIVPADLDDVVDGARVLDGPEAADRRPRGSLDWYPEVAIAIADVLGRRAVDSLGRLAARFVAVSDQRERCNPEWPVGLRRPEVEDFVPAHPVDRAVIAALCDGLVEVGPGPAVGDTAVELGAANELRRIQRYEWQHARGAWTWLRVHEPADATLEEVAATLLGHPDAAYRMSASPPLFGFLPEDAARIPGARAGLPMSESAEQTTTLLGLMRPVDALLGGTVTAQPLDALAQSELGDEAALTQAARTTGPSGAPRRDDAGHHLRVASFALGFLARELGSFGLSWRVQEVRERTNDRRRQLAEVPEAEIGRWSALGEQQAAFLEEITPEVESLTRIAGASPDAGADPALVQLASDLADAIAISDLVDSARLRLEAARARKPQVFADTCDHLLDRAMQDLEAVRLAAALHGPDERFAGKQVLVDDLRARDAELRAEVSRLRIDLAQGRTAPERIEELHGRVRAAQREAELVAAISRINPALAEIESEQDWRAVLTVCEHDLEGARQQLLALKSSLQLAYRTWNRRLADIAARAGQLGPGQAAAEGRAALAALERDLRALGSERLGAALQRAHDAVADARTRKFVADIILLVGMSVVSAGVGALARGAVAAARFGRVGVAIAELSGETASMAGFRVATTDETVLQALSSELLGIAGMTLATRGLRATGARRVFAEARATSGRLGRAGAGVADTSVHAVGMGTGQLAAAQGEHLVREGEFLPADQALAVAGHGAVGGASLGVAHRYLDRHLDRISRLGARGQDLLTRARFVRKVAAEMEQYGDPEVALAVARLHHDAAQAEIARLDEIGRDPDALRELGRDTHATLLDQALRDSQDISEQAALAVARDMTPDIARSPRAAHVHAEAHRVGVPTSSHQQADGSFRHTLGEGEAAIDLFESRGRRWPATLHGEDVALAQLEPVIAGKLYRGTQEQIAHAFRLLHESKTDFTADFIPYKIDPDSGKAVSGGWEVTIGFRRFQVDYRSPLAEEADSWKARAARPDGLGTGAAALERLLPPAPTAAEVAPTFRRAASRDAMTWTAIRENFAAKASRPPRPEAAQLADAGVLPRFIARVGAESDLRAYDTFVRPDRSFGFATDPSELYGLSPAQALYEVGWTREEMRKHRGRMIAVVVVDTRVPVPGPDGNPAHMGVGPIRWADLKRVCTGDPDFAAAAARHGITEAELALLFDIAARSPVKGLPATDDPDLASKMAVLYKLLAERKSTNPLVTGTGMTMREDGQLGAREVMVLPNGTTYPLTSTNHIVVTLGVLDPAEYRTLFPEGD